MSESRLPKRVIDVAPCGYNSVRLMETNGELGVYFCLSHYWGASSRALTTTMGILEKRKQELAWNDLPATFQDASDFVRRLGKRYLWIDSLCILQDSRDDWEVQSKHMASIYQDAYLVLAATKSKDSAGGCYAVMDDSFKSHCFPASFNNKTYEVYCRKAFHTGECLADHVGWISQMIYFHAMNLRCRC